MDSMVIKGNHLGRWPLQRRRGARAKG